MIHHASVYVSNYEKAKEFYAKALAPIAYEAVMDMPQHKVVGMGVKGAPDLWIVEKAAAPGGAHIALLVGDKSLVDAFHKSALEAGATDNGAPGIRKEYSSDYYAAYILDMDKNNIEVVTFK